ncbi:hypothetical protein WA1_39640 [Scytonema hofmannii PCC 7110]|uniref:DUF1802 domain-containing protein n=1 Tax=Scytonema hofmannii PCC 7110 TaxID=128403 RepID=A0A139WYQ1_9CYAN|nr:DUF1802 family protein [Scytonema hofmannii]KYC37584.1 hypothetical protein WA1_39640 [Scytonema hofmannii PCC 7110]
MSNSILIDTALLLAAPDIEALLQGRMIIAMPRTFIHPGRSFALCPSITSVNSLPQEQRYRSTFLRIAQTSIAQLDSEKVGIKAWAKCEFCQILNNFESLEALSQLTVWTAKVLEQMLLQHKHIFLAHLRVYLLHQSVEIPVHPQGSQFIGLPYSLKVSDTLPVLSDRIFALRKQQLEKLQPPQHPELEELQGALASLALTNPAAKQLDKEVRVLLGWASEEDTQQKNPDLTWINDIAALGDRSIEQEEKKTNYQAGTDFENVARRSLTFLGFQVENEYKGGAGGLDLFCSHPYPLVCECKAGRLIPSRTVEELIKLGGMHLGRHVFLDSAKLIIGPGNPSKDTLKASQEWKVSIINAMTLQKLVELKAKYPGAIDLFELKKYLDSGQIDYKIDEYIQKVQKQIQLRLHLVQLVKKHQENTGDNNVEVATLFGAYGYSSPPQSLSREEMHEILLELSSPLTGYLGRIKGSDWKSDRFYFLRDLPIA